VVFVLGGPGSGKSTQCENIVREYGFVHLSAEELIEKSTEEGKNVSTEITIGLLKKEMEKLLQIGKYKFLIDEFPRNQESLQAWEKELADFADIRMVLYFECNEKMATQRLLKRAETSGLEDTSENIKKRYKTFTSETAPLMEVFF